MREYAIRVASAAPGEVVIELPFDDRFSGPPGQFPASMVGTAGDVAAVSSCLSLLPRGWATATLDFTIKMTGVAKGEKLRARGRVLQAGRTNSVGAADVYIVSAEQETLAARCWRRRGISRSSDVVGLGEGALHRARHARASDEAIHSLAMSGCFASLAMTRQLNGNPT